ncbi:FtsH protease activity modulator HflK [bacterium]|nr:FtsH protease activity modulator HflK [bacterium]
MNFEDIGREFQGKEFKMPSFLKMGGDKIFKYIIAAVIVLWFLGGMIYQVNPDEQGVIRRFGKFARVTSPGLRLKLPYPVETVDKPQVTQVKRIEIGYRVIDPGPPARYAFVPKEAMMLTGDENIVNCQVIMQFKIKDAKNYLFNIRNQDETIRYVTESSIRGAVGMHNIDEVLTTGKFEIQEEIKSNAQRILDIYNSGIYVVAVQLQDVHPPKQVIDAFKDVASAREDKERLIRQAEGYRNDIIPKARGLAEQKMREAEGYKEERIMKAQGDVDKFLLVLNEYKKAKSITEQRLYIETMEAILPSMKKYVISSSTKSGLMNILPFEKDIMGKEVQK